MLRYGAILILLLSLVITSVWAQTSSAIFTETMGTVATTTTLATHESNNGFDNDGYTMTQGGAAAVVDVRVSSASTGYTGASGLANIYFTATAGDRGFAIEGIDASNYTSLTLQFAYRKESASALATFAVDYWDGSAYVNVPFTFNEAANAASAWYLSPTISLPAGAQISTLKLRWVKSGSVAIRIDDVVLKGVVNDPTTSASLVNFTGLSTSQMTINWTNGNGAGRVVVVKSGSAVDSDPVDGTSYSATANALFGSGEQLGTGNFVVYSGTGSSVTVTGLTSNTTYHVAVYEFNGSGTATNYKLTTPATGNQATDAPSGDISSDIISSNNEPNNIDYASKQAASITATSDAIRVWSFSIQDGGGSPDADALGTELTDLTIGKGGSNTVTSWANSIRRAALYNGSTEIAEVDVTGETISFSGLSGVNVTANDDGTTMLDLYLTFETAVTDNQQYQFQVNSATANSAGSGFATANAGGAVSDITGDANKLEVTATQLVFTTSPSGYVNTNSNFTVAVAAKDVNSNLDVDAATSVTLQRGAGIGTLSSVTGVTQNLASGVYSWSDVQLNTDGAGVTLTTINGGSLSNPTSNAFEVYSGTLLENFDYTASTLLTAHGWTAHSGAGTNAIAVTASGLTYSGYAGSGVGNAAATTASGEDINRPFTAATSGSVYLSFLVNVTSATATGDYFVHFGDNAAANFKSRLYAKDVTGALEFGISKDGTTVTYTANSYSYATTYLLVLKYTFNAGTGDDVTALYINPTINASEPAATLTEASGADAANIGTLCIRQGSNTAVLNIDGIRLATTWDKVPLPVELTSFTASVKGRGVELAWMTATEVNNHGFEIEKNTGGAWKNIGFVKGHGTTNAPQSYSFIDASAKGTVTYRLKQIDRDGKFEYSPAVEAVVAQTVTAYGLDQNYPNPFNPSTQISYQLVAAGHVTLKIYDMLGKEVASLVDGVRPAGEHTAQFDASRLPSGIYFYTLRTNNFNSTKKMLLVK